MGMETGKSGVIHMTERVSSGPDIQNGMTVIVDTVANGIVEVLLFCRAENGCVFLSTSDRRIVLDLVAVPSCGWPRYEVVAGLSSYDVIGGDGASYAPQEICVKVSCDSLYFDAVANVLEDDSGHMVQGVVRLTGHGAVETRFLCHMNTKGVEAPLRVTVEFHNGTRSLGTLTALLNAPPYPQFVAAA